MFKKETKVLIIKITIQVILSLIISRFLLSFFNASLFGFNFTHGEAVIKNATQENILAFWLLFGFIFLIYLISNNLLYATIGIFLVSIPIAIANSVKVTMRAEPIFPSDISYLRNIPELIGIVDISTQTMVLGLIALLVLFGILYAVNRKFDVFRTVRTRKMRLISIAVYLVLLVGLFRFSTGYNREASYLSVYASNKDMYSNLDDWYQLRNYRNYGFISGLIVNTSGENISKPENYNSTNVHNTMERYRETADKINETRTLESLDEINVITILSESFSNPSNVNGVELSDNPIPYTESKEDKDIAGHIITSQYGGGTANTEYELLTGLNASFLNATSSVAFQSFASGNEDLPSLFKTGNTSKKKTLTIHSFESTFYKRRSVYKTLGVDEQVYQDDMEFTDHLFDTSYISDESAYKEFITRYKETDQPMNAHIVTMQNHTRYKDFYPEYHFEVTSDMVDDQDALDTIKYYTEGLYYTDQFNEQLVNELNEIGKPYILYFYGDHLPGIYSSFEPFNQGLELHTTNYFIVSNINGVVLNDSKYGRSSLPFGQVQIYELANAKISPYQALLLELSNQFQSIHPNQYVLHGVEDPVSFEGLSDEQKQLIEDYLLIQYDVIDGNNYAENYIYYE